jgi:hypothetical protein
MNTAVKTIDIGNFLIEFRICEKQETDPFKEVVTAECDRLNSNNNIKSSGKLASSWEECYEFCKKILEN